METFLLLVIILNTIVVVTNVLVIIRLLFLLATLNRALDYKPYPERKILDEEGEQIMDFLSKQNRSSQP